MPHLIRRLIPALLLVLCCLSAQAEALPPRTAEGFLSPDAGIQEYVQKDLDAGHWLYLSPTLQVHHPPRGEPHRVWHL